MNEAKARFEFDTPTIPAKDMIWQAPFLRQEACANLRRNVLGFVSIGRTGTSERTCCDSVVSWPKSIVSNEKVI